MKSLTYIILFLLPALGLAQADTLLITPDFYFENGIYLNFQDFKRNLPTYSWDDLEAVAHINEREQVVRFAKIQILQDSTIALHARDLWGVCIEGKPYININKLLQGERLTLNKQDPIIFAQLRVLGRLCYFEYAAYQLVQVPVTVYDPVTTNPLTTTIVENWEMNAFKKLLKFGTGDVANYRLSIFMEWIQDDQPLWNTLVEMTLQEAQKKLYKSLHIYNDRNPVYIMQQD